MGASPRRRSCASAIASASRCWTRPAHRSSAPSTRRWSSTARPIDALPPARDNSAPFFIAARQFVTIDRGLDHLVLSVQDLDAAKALYEKLGFNCTPKALHPWGTGNTLAQLQGNFLEILAVVDKAKLAPPAPGQMDFGRYN